MSVLGTRYLNKPWTRTNDVPIWRVTNGTEICLITISSRPPFIFISFTIYEFVGNLRSFEASFFSTNYKSTTHQYVIAHVPLNVNFSCIFSDILKIESISININHKIINNISRNKTDYKVDNFLNKLRYAMPCTNNWKPNNHYEIKLFYRHERNSKLICELCKGFLFHWKQNDGNLIYLPYSSTNSPDGLTNFYSSCLPNTIIKHTYTSCILSSLRRPIPMH